MNKIIRRGDIWWVDFGEQDGSEQSGTRPAVVVSNNKNNKYSPTIQVLPITTANKSKLPIHVCIGKKEGLKKSSIILPEQERTRDRRFFKSRIGHCSKKLMFEIEKAILTQKGINIQQHNLFAS